MYVKENNSSVVFSVKINMFNIAGYNILRNLDWGIRFWRNIKLKEHKIVSIFLPNMFYKRKTEKCNLTVTLDVR